MARIVFQAEGSDEQIDMIYNEIEAMVEMNFDQDPLSNVALYTDNESG